MSLALSSLAIAVLAAVLYALFQKSAPTFSLLVSMAAALILLARVGSAAQSVLSGLVRLEQRAGGDAYGCLLRCTGIVLLTDYARTLCEEAGAESLAWCASLAGRLLVLAAAWPHPRGRTVAALPRTKPGKHFGFCGCPARCLKKALPRFHGSCLAGDAARQHGCAVIFAPCCAFVFSDK